MGNKPGAIGIDLGSHTIRALQLSHSGGAVAIVAASQAPAPPVGSKKGDRFSAHADTIRGLLRQGRFKGGSVVTALPPKEVRLKSFRLPCMPEDELDQAVFLDARQRFHSLDATAEIRYFNAGKVLGGQGEQFELVIMGVNGEKVSDRLAAIRDGGMSSCGLAFSPAAAFEPFGRFLQRGEDEGRITALLDIGYSGTRLIISRGADVAFVKAFDFGVASLQAAMSEGLKVDETQAVELYESLAREDSAEGGELAPDRRAAALESMGPVVQRISKEIGLCMRYFSVTFRGERVEKMVCVGGGARQGDLVKRLGENLGVSVEVGHPFRHVATEGVFTGSDRRGGQPEWATVVGLALQGLRWRSGIQRGKKAVPA